jgi:hypothetical protein
MSMIRGNTLRFIFLLLLVSYGKLWGQIEVEIKPKLLQYNHQTEVPKGLFGVHAGGFHGFSNDIVVDWGIESARYVQQNPSGNPIEPGDGAFDSLSFVVECWWDRFRPPLQLQYPSTWKEMLWSRGHTYATKANPENHKRILEFWNEPYLNWSYKPGVAYDPLWYDQSNMEENGPVRRNGSTEFEPHLIWQYGNWYDPLDKSWAADPLNIYNRISHGWNQKMHEEGCPYPCLEIFSPGDTIYPESTNRIVVFERLIPVDTSQHSYYSARQNEKYYREMYTTLADTVRKLNPDVQLIAGWGFEIHKDNWTPWRQLLKPLLDDHIDLIDGIHQHHYGMDTRIITAEYETIAAYVKIKYNRELKFLNTETGGFIDPQRPESVSNNPGHITQAKKALNAFTYNTKDIVYMLAHSPDKAFSRAIHESQKTNGGVAAAFKILKSLRGDMLFSTSNHKNIWQVASIEDDLITIACFNGDTIDHNVVFSVYAPEGLSLTQVTNIYADTNLLDTIELYSQTDLINNISWSGSRLIKAYSPIVLQFKLSDNVQSITDTVKARQFMADTILAKIPVMGDLTTNIAISDNEVLNNAESARLKFVLMRYESGGKVLINGHEYSLENYAGGNPDLHQGGISYIHINKDHLTDDNVVTFHAGNSDVDLWMVSLELYTEQLSQYLNGIASEEKEKNIFHVYPNPAKELIQSKETFLNIQQLPYTR